MFMTHELEDRDFCLDHLKALLKGMQESNHGNLKVRDLPHELLRDYRALARGLELPVFFEELAIDEAAEMVACCRRDLLKEIAGWG
jgi:hypothetical protein